jgi:hypothetical protein
VVKAIAAAERKYQEELNKGFTGLSEGAFKGLRRQLPVTRQKMEWEKISGYRVGYVFLMVVMRSMMMQTLTFKADKTLEVEG